MFSRFTINPKAFSGNKTRMNAITTAGKEANRIMSQHRLGTAMSEYAPRAADSNMKVADEVLRYCEKPSG